MQGDEEERQGRATTVEQFGDKKLDNDQGNDGQFEHDRLWVIGRLSSVLSRQAPVLMGLIFVLVIAYHPRLSPMPMPLSLVVMTTVSLLVFIVSAVSFRWHFHQERKDTLAELQSKMDEVSQQQEARPTPTPEAEPALTLILPRDEEEKARERAREVAREQKQLQQEQEELQKQRQQKLASLTKHKEKIAAISDGVYQSWNQSPIGWLCGGGTALALVDLWVRWWTIVL